MQRSLSDAGPPLLPQLLAHDADLHTQVTAGNRLRIHQGDHVIRCDGRVHRASLSRCSKRKAQECGKNPITRSHVYQSKFPNSVGI